MITTRMAGKARVLIAAALALLSQSASSESGQAAREAATTIRVSIPDQRMEFEVKRIEASAREHIEALNEQIKRDLAEQLEAIGESRVELVMAAVPKRG